MPISFPCPGCGKRFSLDDGLAGRRIQCRCGQVTRVPVPAAPAEPATAAPFGFSDLGEADTMDSLFEGEAVPSAPKLPPLPAKPAPATPVAAKPKVRVEGAVLAKVILVPLLVVGLLLLVGYLLLSVAARFAPGYATPQEALAAYQQALVDEDWRAQFTTLDSTSQEQWADQLAAMAVAMSKAVPELQAVVRKYGIPAASPNAISQDMTFGGQATADGAGEEGDEVSQVGLFRPSAHLAAQVGNKTAFFVDLMQALTDNQERTGPNNPLLKLQAQKVKASLLEMLAQGQLSALEIAGDQARGTVTYKLSKRSVSAPVQFQRLAGRWFLHRESDEGSFIDLPPSGAGL